jgi:hypothetical protein
MKVDIRQLERVDRERREWVVDWLRRRELPAVESGSYYVRSFQIGGRVSASLKPLLRDNVIRLCFKPPQT